jgi:hypothetical protein
MFMPSTSKIQALNFEYIPIGKHGRKNLYVCLNQNLLIFLWALISKGNCLDFEKKSLLQISRTLKKFVFILGKIFLYRFNGSQFNNSIKHPHFGHFCVDTNNGYKLFDLQKKVAIKLLSEKTSLQKFHQELNRVRTVGTFNFAPSVLKWSMEERWYEEECLEGYRPDDSTRKRFLQSIQEFVVPLIENIFTSSSPQPIHPWDYALKQKYHFFGVESYLSQKDLDPTKVSIVREFVKRIIQLLENSKTSTIFLTLTHGDLSFGHIRVARNGVMAIDWEACEHRSALYDFHDLFFKQPWQRPAWPGFKSDMTGAIVHLQRHMARQNNLDIKKLSSSLLEPDTYRLVYYIERLAKLVKTKNLTDSVLDKSIIPKITIYTAIEKTSYHTSPAIMEDFSRH